MAQVGGVDLVTVDERIKSGIERRRFAQTSDSEGLAKNPTVEKKKGKANAVMVELVFPQGKGAAPSYVAQYANPPLALYSPPRTDTTIINPWPAQQGTRRQPRTLTPIPMSYRTIAPVARAKARWIKGWLRPMSYHEPLKRGLCSQTWLIID
ncbi:hypothetical protein CR513_57173, partial [Mucuna pruriens]